MAAILHKIGSVGFWDDGDVIVAINDKTIARIHAEMLCHPWKAGLNSDGWRPRDSLAEHLAVNFYEFRFERTDRNHFRRTSLWTGEIENFGLPEIDVDLYLRRRMAAKAPDGGPKKAVFGTRGREVWYGGRIKIDLDGISRIWDRIEAKTGRRRDEREFKLPPAGQIELKSHLLLPVPDFADEEREALVGPQYDLADPDNPVLIKKRRVRGSWINGLSGTGVTASQVRDKSRTIDLRDRPPINTTSYFYDKATRKYVTRLT